MNAYDDAVAARAYAIDSLYNPTAANLDSAVVSAASCFRESAVAMNAAWQADYWLDRGTAGYSPWRSITASDALQAYAECLLLYVDTNSCRNDHR